MAAPSQEESVKDVKKSCIYNGMDGTDDMLCNDSEDVDSNTDW
jgi:hypothetical protein